MIGDQLYTPTARDIVAISAAPRRLLQRGVTAGASASIQVIFTVPGDEAWAVSGVTVLSQPGAAQTVVLETVFVTDPLLVVLAEACGWSVTDFAGIPAATQGTKFATGMELVVLPGEKLIAQTNFNAGAASNQVVFTAYGLALPRGNLLK